MRPPAGALPRLVESPACFSRQRAGTLQTSPLHMKSLILFSAFALSASAAFAQGVGYTDTPQIRGQKWLVHDKNRPNPPVVTPGATFSHGAPAPSDATVLFDGSNLDAWVSDAGTAPEWKIENGYAQVGGKGGIRTKQEFGDYQLHIEWAPPAEVKGESQGRGNSGVFMHGRFEVQVLDSYENKTYADGQAGGIYGQWPPLVNPIKKPGEWNSYDIVFEAPHFDADGKLTKPAYVTVFFNGVCVHNRKEINGPTDHRATNPYKAYSGKGPIALQNHGNPTRYRNIWIRPLGEYN
jgi:Domain of Unknown Function (DUF1080)